MVNLKNISKTYVSPSEVDGFGCFTSVDLTAGDIVESFLVLPLPWREHDLDPRTLVFKRYGLVMPTSAKKSDDKYGRIYCVAGGNIMFYNHDAVPTAKIMSSSEIKDEDTKKRLGGIPYNVVIALRDIDADSELFLDYSTCYTKDWADHWPVPSVEEPPLG